MKHLLTIILFISGAFCIPSNINAQIIKEAGRILNETFSDDRPDETAESSSADDGSGRSDSLRLLELQLKLEEMKLRELSLQMELNNAKTGGDSDSIKQARNRQIIDSLRNFTQGVPVVVGNDTLFRIYAARGGYSPRDRAEMIQENLTKIIKNGSLGRDSIYLLENDNYIDVMYGDRVIITITDQDAMWHGTSRHQLAERYVPILSAKIKYLENENSFWQILKRGALFIAVILLIYLLFKLTNFLFRKLRRQIIRFKQQKMKPLIVRDYELLNKNSLCRMLISLSNLLRYFVLLCELILTVPILFAIFPQTENLALKIFYYIVDPIRMVLKAVADYIPNLFIIIVIWYCVRYIIKGLRYITEEIKHEKLKISGFYPDWAEPTFNIIRVLLYAFMIAIIYPYLPGAQSGVFQGISVFVGLIVSLGSSTVIANFIAGFVITYMRPFKTGDFIKVKDTIGNVIEKTPFVTRLRTIKNEVVTIPNSFIMSSNTVNYSASARRYGLIIHTMLTMGYETPWRKVHDLLVKAALATPGVLDHPEPFVLETELNDNYMCYQINAYIKDADNLPQITSDLHQNIQDFFHHAGIELVAPHYFATRDGNQSKIPEDWKAAKE